MSNVPYRTMEIPPAVQLTWLEKLFLSGSKWKRLLFHVVVIGEPVACTLGFIAGMFAFAGAIYGVFWSIYNVLGWLARRIESHYQLTNDQAGGIVFGLSALIVVSILFFFKIRKQIAYNNSEWSRTLQIKLNPPILKVEDGDIQ
jgi:hypothetical protein